MADKGMSVSEAARLWEVRVEEVYRLLRAGRVPAHKVNGKWVITGRPITPARRASGNR